MHLEDLRETVVQNCRYSSKFAFIGLLLFQFKTSINQVCCIVRFNSGKYQVKIKGESGMLSGYCPPKI